MLEWGTWLADVGAAIQKVPAGTETWRAFFKDFAGPIVTGFAAIVAASITGYFAYQQWKLGKRQVELSVEKIRLDLFEDRYAVYVAIVDFLYRIEDLTIEKDMEKIVTQFKTFRNAVTKANFLFPDLKPLWMTNVTRANRVISSGQYIRLQIDNKRVNDSRVSRTSELIDELVKEIRIDLTKIEEGCRPYLEFKSIVSPSAISSQV